MRDKHPFHNRRKFQVLLKDYDIAHELFIWRGSCHAEDRERIVNRYKSLRAKLFKFVRKNIK